MIPFPEPVTMGRMLRVWAEKTPDQCALVGPDRSLSYSALSEEVQSVATRLREAGLQIRDSVGMLATRTVENVVLFLACSEARLAVAPLNPSRPIQELQRMCEGFGIRAIAWEKRFLQNIEPCLKGRVSIALDDCSASHLSYQTLAEGKGKVRLQEEALVDDAPYLNLTSGSTGDPKAAITTQRALYWNTRSTAEAMRFEQDEPFLCLFSPHAHPHELFCRTLYLGSVAVLEPATSPKKVAATLSKERVRCVMAVPSTYRILADHASLHPFPHVLRLLECGGAPSDAGIIADVKRSLGVALCPVWGSTETAGMAIATPPGASPAPGAVGLPCPSYHARLEPDEKHGELVIDGDGLFSSYLKLDGQRIERTGPHRTGDIFGRDDAGWFHFLGRESSLIKVSGEKVHPEKIETLLLEHPLIAEVCVQGAPHSSKGTVAIAFAVCSDPSPPKPSEIRQYCRTRLTPRETPQKFVWCEALPRLPSGKMDRKKMEEMAREIAVDED